MRKKVGIITFQNAHNYGAVLQAYALQTILSEKYDVEIINYKNPMIERGYRVFVVSRENPKKFTKTLITSILYSKKTIKRRKKFYEFNDKYLKLSKAYMCEDDLKESPPEYDIYITGSDQVWNYGLTRGLSDIYTLNFGNEKVKRISYAASIGISELPSEQKEVYRKKIDIIDNISVREKQGKIILDELYNHKKDIKVVLDPTLLLSRNHWDIMVKDESTVSKEDYIFVYGIGKQQYLFDIVNYVAERSGKRIVHFNKTNGKYKNILKNAYTADPGEFLSYIKNSKCTIVRSFHGMVFSIIYHKNFFVVPDETSYSRMVNLLDKIRIR